MNCKWLKIFLFSIFVCGAIGCAVPEYPPQEHAALQNYQSGPPSNANYQTGFAIGTFLGQAMNGYPASSSSGGSNCSSSSGSCGREW